LDVGKTDYPFLSVAHPEGGGVLVVNPAGASYGIPRVLRVGPTGTLLWQTDIVLAGYAIASAVAAKPDGTLFVAVRVGSSGAVLALSSSGAVSWTATLPGAGFGELTGLSATLDGGVAGAGTHTGQSSGASGWFLRFDGGGKLLLQTDLGPTSEPAMARIRPSGDGFALALGAPDAAPEGDLTDLRIVRLDGAGKVVVDTVFHEEGNDFTNAFAAAPSGALVAAGHRILYGKGYGGKDFVGWARRIEPDGTSAWTIVDPQKAFGDVIVTGDALAMLAWTTAYPPNDAFVVNLGLDGKVLQTQPLPATLLPGLVSLLLSDPTAIVVSGISVSATGPSKAWLARLGASCSAIGCPDTGCL
jgi:hypothetical protein